jgi:hypothetical protein
MSAEDHLEQSLRRLQEFYLAMQEASGPLVYRDVGPHRQSRHENLTESLVCYLKGVKAVSTLNACVVLLRQGFTQEIGALCRMVDDFFNEILFLLVPQGENGFSPDQVKFLEAFFQEELDADNLLRSTQKRDTVSARTIHASIGRLAEGELNPSDTQELFRTTHQALSGYVHGAYPHIMEMFGGEPAHFHMGGMLGTPRIDEWRGQLIGYVQRLTMITVLVARKLGKTEMEAPIRAFLEEFESATNTKPKISARKMLAQYKREHSK